MSNDYYLELIRQKPIDYNGLLFYPVSFEYICDNIGLDSFNKILYPFLITKDCFDIEEDQLKNMDLFNDIIMKDKKMLSSIFIIMKLFCKCQGIQYSDNTIYLCLDDDKVFQIDSSNFDDISGIIRLINGQEKIKVEKPPKNMSEKQRDVWNKLQTGRKKDMEKNMVHIYDILNVCEFGGNYRIPEEEIEKWTLWKIMNCYKARKNIKTYDDNLKICLVSYDGKSISGNNHWHQKLMIRE